MAALSWAAILGLLAALVWFDAIRAVNADELYALTLIGDLWADTPFRWMLQPYNGLFPGLLIAGFAFTAGLNGIGFYLFFAAAFSVLLFVAISFVLHHSGVNKKILWSAAALAVMLICFVGDKNNFLRRLLFFPASHAGVLPLALFAFGLATQSVENVRPRIVWLCALATLSTFSDMLTVLQVILPVVGGMILIAWEAPQLRTAAAAVGSWTTVAGLLGLALYFAVGWSGMLDHGTLGLSSVSMRAAAQTYVLTFPQLVSRLGLMHIGFAILGIGAGAVVTVRAVLSGRIKQELPIALMTFSSFAGLAGPILAGTYSQVALFRHQLPFYTMPVIILILLMCRMLRNRAWILLAAAAVLGVAIMGNRAASAWQRLPVLNPSSIEIADLLVRLPADLMLAGYWTSKPVYIASQRHLMVCPIVYHGLPYIWIANYGWCVEGLNRWAMHRQWLAIDMDDRAPLDSVAIVNIYGRPDREITVQNQRIWLYSWSHDRQSNLQRIVCASRGKFRRTPPC
jgi:hypothetical protein